METRCFPPGVAVGVALLFAGVLARAQNSSTCTSLSTINACLNNPAEKCYWCDGTCSSTNATGGCLSSSCNGTTATNCTNTTNCGWCNTTAPGYASNCQYHENASMPSGSCTANWTPYAGWPCSFYVTQTACLDRTCYWCGTSCSSTLSSPSSCAVPWCSSDLTANACLSSIHCGWCDAAFAGYSSCQDIPPEDRNGSQPLTCYAGWKVNKDVTQCSMPTTINDCLNLPDYDCYWCGSFCSAFYLGSGSNCTRNAYCKTRLNNNSCLNGMEWPIDNPAWVSCGWCVSPLPGFKNCLFTSDGSQPSACNGSWTPSPTFACYHQETKADCFNYDENWCYWCSDGSLCSPAQSSGCTRFSCYQRTPSKTSCMDYNFPRPCGWCKLPWSGYGSCLYSDNGTEPSSGCMFGWTPDPSSTCANMKTQNDCFNNPDFTSCYWCGTFCSSTATLSSCFASECWTALPSQCQNSTADIFANCGWCTDSAPRNGRSWPNCLYSADGRRPPLAGCSNGWAPNTVASPVCPFYTTKSACTTSASYCGWCNITNGTFGRCQPQTLYEPLLPSASCHSGWTNSSYAPVSPPSSPLPGVSASVIAAAVVAPLTFCGGILFLAFLLIRKRRLSRARSALLESTPEGDRHIPDYVVSK